MEENENKGEISWILLYIFVVLFYVSTLFIVLMEKRKKKLCFFVNLSKKRVIYRNQSVNYVRSVCDIAKTLNHYY